LGFGGSVEGVKLVVFYFLSASEFWPKKEGWSLMGVAPLEGDKLGVFYFLSASECWPEKRGGLWWE
jgi:hypothetical protein